MRLSSMKPVLWVGNELVCRFGPPARWTVLLSWYTVWGLSLYSRLHVATTERQLQFSQVGYGSLHKEQALAL